VSSLVVEHLSRAAWESRRTAHEQRVDGWTAGHRDRAARAEAHPVEDFLFTYYSQRPSRLRRWSPGPGVLLEEHAGAGPFVAVDGGAVLGPPPERVRRTAGWVAELLARTAERAAQYGCFGLHEWAMVHGGGQRHERWPLRLGQSATNAVVEALPVRCSHFDAFRFFTPSARPLNALQPTRETQADLEQPGCLHATMDLYKWAYKLGPWVVSELVADCFDLARRVRVLDMRASPYDLAALGYDPVTVETPEGRAVYVEQQRAFVAEAAPLRERLLLAAQGLVVCCKKGAGLLDDAQG
jgi:hypothetical protein